LQGRRVVGQAEMCWTVTAITTSDLCKLSLLVPTRTPTVPPEQAVIATSLLWQVREREPCGHQDREFVQLVIKWIREGFRIG
jgi:hypothetical protein